MTDNPWFESLPAAITVCDRAGTIVEMNAKSRETFAGGRTMVGSSVYDCHPEPARTKLRELLEQGGTNVYTIQKRGKKKLIYQAPWYKDGKPAGLVELSLEMPDPLPHHVRD